MSAHKKKSLSVDKIEQKPQQNGSNSLDKSNKKSKKQTGKVIQKREGKSRSKNLVDIFNEHAMMNAYYTCHNVQDLLKNRGFPWPELAKKKKKSKK